MYGSTVWAAEPGPRLVAAAPGGLAWSGDGGATWTGLDERDFWAVGGHGETAWAVGPDGRIVKLVWP